MTTVGILGAGHIGSTLARGLVDRGYDVVLSNSRGPETLVDLVAELGEHARAATAEDAAAAADWAIVTVPLKAYPDIPVEALAGKIVLDTNNYYPQRDGQIAALDEKRATTSGLLQQHLPESKVAKAFNSIRFDQILTDGRPAGAVGRRALATASDFAEASALVTDVYNQFGYDTVEIGSLSESWRIERDQPGYVVRLTDDQLRDALARAIR